MPLAPGCLRCAAPVAPLGPAYVCPQHGEIAPLWRADGASYDGFVDHLELAGGMPTFLPWPLERDWLVGDFAVVPESATLTTVRGRNLLDGHVEVVLILEDPGVGLGERVVGLGNPDEHVTRAPAATRLRVEERVVPLWAPDVPETDLDRSVLVGEHGGRWLWIVLRPASAALLLASEWRLRDVGTLGVGLAEVPFGGPPGPW